MLVPLHKLIPFKFNLHFVVLETKKLVFGAVHENIKIIFIDFMKNVFRFSVIHITTASYFLSIHLF